MYKILNLFLLTFSFLFFSCTTDQISYFDQEPPLGTPTLFAPMEVNTDSIELNVVFNSKSTEMFFSRIVNGSFVIYHSELVDGSWTPVSPTQLYPDSVKISVACDPTITQDGNTMYFLGVDPNNYSNDISPGELYRIPPDIYRSKKKNGKWQLATKVESGISTEYLESYPVVVADGSLYFQSNRPGETEGRKSYRAQSLADGKFDTPVQVTSDAKDNALIGYVNPTEVYAFAGDGKKFQLLYKKDGNWVSTGELPLKYEKDWIYYCPYMSSDDEYFIFSRRYNNPSIGGWAGVEKGEVYWVHLGELVK